MYQKGIIMSKVKTTDKKHHFKNDALLVAVILIIAMIAFVIFKFTMQDGAYVTVSIDGEEKYCYSLSEDREFEITTGNNGEHLNILVIKDGKAYVSGANCPDKVCANHKAISKTGETIVCLPHKVVISIVAENVSGEPDVVV